MFATSDASYSSCALVLVDCHDVLCDCVIGCFLNCWCLPVSGAFLFLFWFLYCLFVFFTCGRQSCTDSARSRIFSAIFAFRLLLGTAFLSVPGTRQSMCHHNDHRFEKVLSGLLGWEWPSQQKTAATMLDGVDWEIKHNSSHIGYGSDWSTPKRIVAYSNWFWSKPM